MKWPNDGFLWEGFGFYGVLGRELKLLIVFVSCDFIVDFCSLERMGFSLSLISK
jgi:hypothetical protein